MTFLSSTLTLVFSSWSRLKAKCTLKVCHSLWDYSNVENKQMLSLCGLAFSLWYVLSILYPHITKRSTVKTTQWPAEVFSLGQPCHHIHLSNFIQDTKRGKNIYLQSPGFGSSSLDNWHVLTEYHIKGCDSNFEVKCSNFKSRYKWNDYLAFNIMY